MTKRLPLLLLILVTLAQTACKSVDNEENVAPKDNTPDEYSGPAAASSDVNAFQQNVWNNLRANSRCGNCHGTNGTQQQTPLFVREDDINQAYSAILTVVDINTPINSTIIKKISSGHAEQYCNNWLGSISICAATITAYLENWLNPAPPAPEPNNDITYDPPTLYDPSDGKSFPNDPGLFETTVWPILTDYCSQCHSSQADIPQSPYIAESDVTIAYEAARSGRRIDLNNPADSRLVVRLSEEFHNCWSDCQLNADEIEAAITAMANGIPTTPLDPALVHSKAQTLYQGTPASEGGRYTENQIALYKFDSGSGSTIYDRSLVAPQLNLTLTGEEGVDYQWVGGWGIELFSASARGTVSGSSKLTQRIAASDAYTIEAWLVPANVTQEGPARIISYSANNTLRNFTLGQTLYNYDFAQRSSSSDANGAPLLSTPDADEVLQATQQHVAITFSPQDGRRIYVNGELVASETASQYDNLNDWDENFTLLFGAEADSSSPWQGKLRLVAIYEQALTQQQIQQNMEAGVGERYFLLFSISDLVNVAESYVVLEVSQFDNYSYLFHSPRLISLSDNPGTVDIALQDMRIGINGEISEVGQAYRNLDLTIDAAPTDLSSLGTVIPLQQGPEWDEFFLSFGRLGDHTNVILDPVPPTPADPTNGEPQPRIGLRTFAEINATLSQLTGVAITQTDVQATYSAVVQQLPADEKIDGFLSSHQIGISQLAVEYCNALIEDTDLRSQLFPGFDFTTTVDIAFASQANRDLLLDPLIERFNGNSLATQPNPADIKIELNALIDRLSICTGSCAADRTLSVAKGSCAALLASAVMVLQ